MAWTDLPILSVGQVLTASHMNNVKGDIEIGHRVCTSSTRPASPSTGSMIYESDTGKVLVWDGSAWAEVPILDNNAQLNHVNAPANSVIQFAFNSTQTQASTTSQSRVFTNLQATITPYRNDSYIAVQAQLSTRRPTSGNAGIGFDIRRNGTVIMNQTQNYYLYNSADVSGGNSATLYAVDDPASTSPLTYTVYFSSYSGSLVECQDDNAYQSWMFLWEIKS